MDNKTLIDLLTPEQIMELLDETGHFPVSSSRMHHYECPHYFLHTHVLKTPEIRFDPPVLGKFGHQVMAEYAAQLRASKTDTDMDLFEKTITETRAKYPDLTESQLQDINEPLLKTAEKLLFPHDQMLEPEMKIALTWDLRRTEWDAKDAWIRMIIDLAMVTENSLEALVVDFKTQPGVPSAAELQKDIQVMLYPWALYTLNPKLEAIEVWFVYMRAGRVRKFRFPTNMLHTAEARMRKFSEYITDKIVKYADKPILEEWPAKPPKQCPYCSFPCPLMNIDADAASKIVTAKTDIVALAESVRNWVKQVDRLKDAIKKAEKSIKGWSNAHEEFVRTSDGTYGFYPSDTMKFNVGGVVDLLLKEGIDVDEVVKIDKDKVKGLENEEVREKLLHDPSLVTIKESDRFKFRPKEPEGDK